MTNHTGDSRPGGRAGSVDDDGPAAIENGEPTERDGLSRRRYLATLAAASTIGAVGASTAAAQSASVQQSAKRGYVGSDPSRANAIGAGWYYTYMPTEDNRSAFDGTFVPMINGDDLWWTSGASDAILQSDYDAPRVLGYNEPEHEEGYTDVQTILDPHWRTLCDKFRDTDVAVCTPSIKTGTATGRAYFDDFMAAVESDDALSVDEIAVHWYAGTEAMRDDPVTQARRFLDQMESLYQNYGQRPIWITEFGGPNFANVDADALAQSNIRFLQETIPELESRDYIAGYAWWEGGRATKLTESADGGVQLTDVGRAYVGLDAGGGLSDLPTSETVAPGRYRIENVGSGLPLEVADGSTDDGADVQQGADTGAAHERWDLEYEGDGRFRLVAGHSGAVADVEDAGTEDGANVQQWAGNDGEHQRWHVDPVGDGQYRIVAAHSGLVMDVLDGSTEPGTSVAQWQWNGGDNQRWRFVRDDGGTPEDGTDTATPTDTEAGVLVEDVNGNGESDFGDVTSLFDRMDSIEDGSQYDFNGNGELDFGDVVALFERL